VIGLTFGCAHSHDKFYFSDGTLCAEVKSTVLGTGETVKTVIIVDCGAVEYDTKDTGVSENAGKLAESLAKGAVKGINPVP
jgi:hypothetical protein